MIALRNPQSGFTLIEALVALMVLSVGALSMMAAAEGHTQNIGKLTDRQTARWIAETALTEYRLGLPVAEQTTQLGRDWSITILAQPTAAAKLESVSVTVNRPSGPSVALRGFVARSGP